MLNSMWTGFLMSLGLYCVLISSQVSTISHMVVNSHVAMSLNCVLVVSCHVAFYDLWHLDLHHTRYLQIHGEWSHYACLDRSLDPHHA